MKSFLMTILFINNIQSNGYIEKRANNPETNYSHLL